MRTSMILPLLLSLAMPLAAQSPVPNARSQYRFPPDRMACPVDLRADRRASGVIREIDGKPIPTGQGLVLHFRASDETTTTPQGTVVAPRRTVTSADIVVHGHSAAVMAQPLTIPNRATELTETFHLTGSATDPLVEKSLWTSRIHGITWIELTRVTFSDGTSWQRTIPSECRIEPTLFVLVQ